ncbi:hypothetical protein LEP1GSC195_0932 [Leptospira wolbachii serovar Codice str. CDC]|uniref:TIGR04255 family protein n=1 Tax=Leptospira wolbachii serovar Codice str. CDC TaxID=1218599 RepID=R8ZY10_9LEPT|nr:hypothetical protein [Leptospira wolbachii]EOQ94823.1 hypothetical protein LEP1GSC195_0932 [Leptospira wolbachii serovar Codice str. CDC]
MSQIPILDRRFCLDLFGDPYNTSAGTSEQGFIITKHSGRLPYPSVIINPQRIQIIGHESFEVADLYEKVTNEIVRVTNGSLPLFYSNIGLNTEHEWNDIGENGETWLTDRFIQNGLRQIDRPYITKTLDLRFEVIIGDDQRFNIQLQPRKGVSNSLYAAINDHRIWTSITTPDKKVVEDLLDDSVRELKQKVFNIFLT